jgi:hypothetical protein
MIKKTITYEDFEGNERKKDFYFHMNQVEFSKLNGEVPGGLEKRIQEIIDNQDEDAMLRLIDLMVSRSYGEKDEEDGGFTKIGKNGRPLYEKFVNTSAYDKLIIELIQGESNIVKFLTGIMPNEIQTKINEEYKKQKAENAPKLTPVPVPEE